MLEFRLIAYKHDGVKYRQYVAKSGGLVLINGVYHQPETVIKRNRAGSWISFALCNKTTTEKRFHKSLKMALKELNGVLRKNKA